VEVLHAAVPGRVRIRIVQLLGKPALVRELEARFREVTGIRSATGSARTASVLLAHDTSQDVETLRLTLERSWKELLRSWQPPEELPSVVATLPLRQASLRDMLGALERVVAKLSPATGQQRESGSITSLAPSAPSRDPAAGLSPVWHALAEHDVLDRLQAGRDGLSEAEVALRWRRHGPNAQPVPERRSKLSIFGAQF
jgi:hypothetical protein